MKARIVGELAVLIAAIFRLLADMTDSESRGVKTALHAQMSPLPQLDNWRQLYRNHRGFTVWARRSLKNIANRRGQAGTGSEGGRGEDSRHTDASSTQSDWDEISFPPDDAAIRRILGSDHSSKSSRTDGEQDGEPMSVWAGFLWQVWLPCWVAYRVPPGIMLRRARCGDHAAFEALLRLDKSSLADPVLARRWHNLMYGSRPGERQRFLDAIAGGPKVRIDEKSVRSAGAGMISQMGRLLGTEIDATAIQQIFDGIERVLWGDLIDRKLPTGGALTKAIQRHRNWTGWGLLRLIRPGQ